MRRGLLDALSDAAGGATLRDGPLVTEDAADLANRIAAELGAVGHEPVTTHDKTAAEAVLGALFFVGASVLAQEAGESDSLKVTGYRARDYGLDLSPGGVEDEGAALRRLGNAVAEAMRDRFCDELRGVASEWAIGEEE